MRQSPTFRRLVIEGLHSGFGHLGLDERRSLPRLREARVPVAEIASRLGRHRSTIYRKLARNYPHRPAPLNEIATQQAQRRTKSRAQLSHRTLFSLSRTGLKCYLSSLI